MANSQPNSYKVMLMKGQIHATDKAGTGAVDVFKIILMQSGFVFDKDNHNAYADVIASEIPNGNGYTTGGITLSGVGLVVNNTDDRADLTFNNAQWDAVTGSLVASGAILYDDTTDSATEDYTDAIVSYKDAGGDITATPGTPIIVQSIKETVE
ncbi:hypothetical protein KAR91_28670 [Candidatus Pacearchaeota archaeon]|nr:hypothetical protein [Candidatus Pacearchaeota archaeon]